MNIGGILVVILFVVVKIYVNNVGDDFIFGWKMMYLVLSMLTAILVDWYQVAVLISSRFISFIKSCIFLTDLK
jgi:hypothetical protein